jgi:hypothetical protein
MQDRNNPLKHIPPQVFTFVKSFREEFIRDLADISTRYQTARVLSFSMVPVLMVRDEHQDRITYQQTRSIEELIHEIEASRADINLYQIHTSMV